MNTSKIAKEIPTSNFSFPASVVAPLAVRLYEDGAIGAVDLWEDGRLYETRYPNAEAFCDYYETMFTRDRILRAEAECLRRWLLER